MIEHLPSRVKRTNAGRKSPNRSYLGGLQVVTLIECCKVG